MGRRQGFDDSAWPRHKVEVAGCCCREREGWVVELLMRERKEKEGKRWLRGKKKRWREKEEIRVFRG